MTFEPIAFCANNRHRGRVWNYGYQAVWTVFNLHIGGRKRLDTLRVIG